MSVYISDIDVTANIPVLVPGNPAFPRVIIPEELVWVGDENIVPGNGVPVARGRHHMVLPGEWYVVSNRPTQFDVRIPNPEGELEAYVKTVSPLTSSTPPPDTTEYIPLNKEFVVYFQDGDLVNWPAFTVPSWAAMTRFWSVKHINAPNPLALMAEGDAWDPHPDASIYETMYA